jgi:NAD(P)-dependent dehydrogenase (short-subunit alcohol dehydrogenase family)
MPNASPMIPTGRFDGARVIVTGGARGIGGAIASRFAAEGGRVAILDRLVDLGCSHAEAIGGSFHEVDLASADQTRHAMAAAVARLGGVDVLVNSAGILQLSPLLDVSVDDWDRTFAINTRAMLVTMQESARVMLEQGAGGRIVNIASMAAKHGGAGEGAYPASKAAVVGLTRVAALEWGQHGITVNAICPGYVLTEMGAATRTPEAAAGWAARSPLGRLGTTEEVAGVALFLASDESAYLTGQAVNVTGGMIMH